MTKFREFVKPGMTPLQVATAIKEASVHYSHSRGVTLLMLIEQGQLTGQQMVCMMWGQLVSSTEATKRLQRQAWEAYEEYEEARRKEERHEDNQRVLKEARDEILPRHIL